jgi:hypothetical protein
VQQERERRAGRGHAQARECAVPDELMQTTFGDLPSGFGQKTGSSSGSSGMKIS